MTREVSNSADVLDSRDIIARIEELEELEAAYATAKEAFEGLGDDATADDTDEAERALQAAEEGFDEDAQEELKSLRELEEQAEGYSGDWRHGATLIRDSYFKTYAQELAEDIGAINRDAAWPNSCIDWEQAADELKADYTAVEFGDVTYWVR